MKNVAHLDWCGRFAMMAVALAFLTLPALAASTPATFSTTGSSVTTTLLEDNTTIVTFLGNGTITLGDDAHVSRVLVVGGGGGGGIGGGGGGAVVEVSEGLALEAGTPISVTVGAGGKAGSNMDAGNNGGTSSFGSFASALGGGAGGAFNSVARTGGANGGGGGARNNADMSGALPAWADGHKGGNGRNTGGSGTGSGGGGGGGGAGADGQDSQVFNTSAHNDTTPESAGNGGDGLASDITGTVVYYGGGGGGGIRRSNFKYGGLGGAGGGGRGFGLTPGAESGPAGSGKVMTNPQSATAGTDGLGGGGGGAGWDASGKNFTPGKGGSGVVIVRIDPVAAGPEPHLSVDGVADGPESATVTVRLDSVGDGAETADLSYAIATSAAGLDSATPVAAAADVAANQAVSFTIPGLTAGTTYHIRLFAENDLGETCHEDVECMPYASLVPVTAVGAARVFDVGLDRVAVFNRSSDTMTLTLAERDGVELLLVGGGGGGGSYEAGGGGAGGFLHLENAVLDAGTYTVSVGAGGAPASAYQGAGGNGGDTTLARSGESESLFTAHGGGGGGGYSDRPGRSGGSGGGAGPQAGTGGLSLAAGAELGNPGGQNSAGNTSLYFSSGGGGAGEPGSHADYVNILGGKGGDGLPCSITGEEVWYAGGGGAGQNDNSTINGLIVPAGLGGRGGGGMGGRTADDMLDDYECGVDGLGGGGGGGRRPGKDGVGYPSRGGSGGSGTLIVRWRATPDSGVRATVDSVAGSVCGAFVSGSVQLAGASGATLEMAVGPAGGSLGSWETLGTGLAAGESFTLTLAGLAAGTEYDYAIRVRSGTDAGDILGAATGSFETFPAAPATLSGDPADATKTTVGTDTVYAFSAPGTYTFTVATRGYARLLMVGGGGAGGTSRGGGGGAGGFIELPATTLEAGTYTVVVGAGGAISTGDGVGGNGGDTTLARSGAAQVLYTAHGGGGGGYNGSALVAGAAGGSGGGAGPCSAVAAASTAVAPELGHPGGTGSGTTASGMNNAAAGGGGAGGPGEDGHSSEIPTGVNRRQAGAGGPGVASDITGETLWYAGGGGGGSYYDANGGYRGLGGSGVGGDGGGYADEVCQNVVSPTPGVAGTGSGGGGGYQSSNSSGSSRRGAAGGCGAFILRLAADAPAALPEVAIDSLSAEATSAGAVLALRGSGSAATADLSLVYGTAAEVFSRRKQEPKSFP